MTWKKPDHFDRLRRWLAGKPVADFLCPGHPLLDATIDLMLERYRDSSRTIRSLQERWQRSQRPGQRPDMEAAMTLAEMLMQMNRRTAVGVRDSSVSSMGGPGPVTRGGATPGPEGIAPVWPDTQPEGTPNPPAIAPRRGPGP